MTTNQTTTVPSFIFTDQAFQKPAFCGGFGMPSFGSSSTNNNHNETSQRGGGLSTEKEELDKLLADKMNGLSVKDRETMLEEVNGIAHSDPEEPSRLNACLEELDNHLKTLKEGTVYEQAERMDSAYVSNRAFRLKFLRAKRYTTPEGETRYDPKRASELIINFFQTKQTLFGSEKLTKDITLNDLTPEDREGIARGSLQVLPNRDMGGRHVVINFRGFAKFHSLKSEVRAKYYTFMSIMESEEAQKAGVVLIFYTVGQYQESKDGGSLAKQGRHMMTLPIHWAATQVCVDDYKQYILLKAFFQIVPAQFAAKVRVHFGTHLENQYTLRGYGIPEGSLPISPADSSLLLYNHLLWYNQREAADKERENSASTTTSPAATPQMVVSSSSSNVEQINTKDKTHKKEKDDLSLGIPMDEMDDDVFSLDPFDESDEYDTLSRSTSNSQIVSVETSPCRSTSPNTAISPRSTDILFGQSHKSHPGNLRFHEVITQHVGEYEAASGRQKKIEFAEHLVQHIKASGVRFLIYDKGSMRWMEVPDTKARNKVSKTIRNRRRSADYKD
ncbi:unnamed protein product [Cylindrotheca closterium]|uniref:DUF6824 domain-containing protein n=1 Tax=Cylindrotheca closterium TaxID=2856 RepID=A0AAD2FY79_9STRA|nr:unnamed protein product [Cylindrotheca closterium]